MTKFEELQEIITRKKNKGDVAMSLHQDKEELEVAGSESSKTPLLSCGDDDMDMDLTDQLYRKSKHVPNRGEGSASWDATWD